ncbi:hypothetical protein CkaCkLH20_11700 [Colletotrichum karsti]|uniref:DUF6590 domain-containing protein n=1 Tax=Colletotrichum karsti TaxID=1095194 RepID=A0A9P6HYQ0_9PEZI|nr:uncharacterized protein CkaCkLH20_11700 [Colletotrichum karsti]KAF9870801.1 hypothetical protein CkaCkLH20_11700 [Colletotrichum karsti]
MPKHSSSKQKSSKQASAWSEWVYSDEHGCHYCYRTLKNGEVEYQWENVAQASSAQEHQDETTPRGIEQITEDVHNLSVADEPEPEDPESAYRLESDPADSGHGPDSGYGYNLGSQTGGYETGGYEARKTSKSRRKGKTVSYAEPDPPDPNPDDVDPDDVAPMDPFYGARRGTEAEHQQGEALPTESDYSQTNGYDPNAQQDYDAQLTEAMNTSDQHNFGYPDEGESSTDPAYAYSEEAEDDGQSTPRAGGPVHDSELEHGQLDSLEPSKKFKQGAIFKVVWSEPQGVTTNNTLVTEKKLMKDPYGGSFYVGSRRFIVVATDKGHSTCVPILTYQGRGCGKPGVHPMNHGIIHEKNRHAQMLPREPELGFEPVKAKLTVEGERLQKESRVNYAKLTTIEHNIKVFFIGSVVKDEIHYIRDAVDYCWERKS